MSGKGKIGKWARGNGFTREDTGGGTESLLREEGGNEIMILPRHGLQFRSIRQAVVVGVRTAEGKLLLSFEAGPLRKMRFAT